MIINCIKFLIKITIIFGLMLPKGANFNPIFLKSKLYIFISGVVISPFVETLIFQTLPLYVINKYIKNNKVRYCLFVFVSPILFIHTFTLSYMLVSYVVGIVFAFFYLVAFYRREKAMVLIVIIHSINNFISFIVLL